MKLLITSGCSYSTYPDNWPTYTKNFYNCDLYNLAVPSVGNDWIYRSIVFGVHSALKAGVAASDIVVSVMWTHLNRKGFYITKNETLKWDLLTTELLNEDIQIKNPANFTEIKFGSPAMSYIHDNSVGVKILGTWVIGNSSNDTYEPINHRLKRKNEIDKYRTSYYKNFYTEEGSFIETLEHILNLQWFCKSLGIKLINQSYIDLFYYPEYNFFTRQEKNTHVTDKYPHLSYLYELINFSNWTNIGLHEYTRDNNLPFQQGTATERYGDGHPTGIAHEMYVKNVLIPKFTEMNIT
jgi:hypothetical protein